MLGPSELSSDCWVLSPGRSGVFLSGSQRTQELLVVSFSPLRTNEEATWWSIVQECPERGDQPRTRWVQFVFIKVAPPPPPKKVVYAYHAWKNHCLGMMSQCAQLSVCLSALKWIFLLVFCAGRCCHNQPHTETQVWELLKAFVSAIPLNS